MVGGLWLALAVVATCLAQPSVAGEVSHLTGSKFLKQGVGHGMDYTKLEMSEREKQLVQNIKKNEKKSFRTSIAGLSLLLAGALAAQIGGIMFAIPNPDAPSIGVSLLVPGLLGVASSIAPFAVAGASEEKVKTQKKELSDLARKRAESNRRNDLVASLLRRPVIAKNGSIVGMKAQAKPNPIAPEGLPEGLMS